MILSLSTFVIAIGVLLAIYYAGMQVASYVKLESDPSNARRNENIILAALAFIIISVVIFITVVIF